MDSLSRDALLQLIRMVFPRLEQDRALGILVDMPRSSRDDSDGWRQRRQLAMQWKNHLLSGLRELGLERVTLYVYENVGGNNVNLPDTLAAVKDKLPNTFDAVGNGLEEVELKKIFSETQLFLALTEYSATAPLKLAGRAFGFRAATMPGFSTAMIPALQVDFEKLCRRLNLLKEKLDEACAAEILFLVDKNREYKMFFDLLHRQAIVSSGRFMRPGEVGNLPSGETYIVPYEGEKAEASRTEGLLPVQIRNSLVLYKIKHNRARSISGDGEAAKMEELFLNREPAYGNMAELGFGVLADFGVQPVGEILLDEKLGLHVGFGRSDHFGGFVGVNQFTQASNMVHVDQIFVPACQPRISVRQVVLRYPDRAAETIMKNDKYMIF
jgi:hypothetical protein